ncbi:MAG: hypothetical protein ACTSQJ_15550 [Promethearchaeota archaeon]
MVLEFNGFIKNITYSPKFALPNNLEEYELAKFDSNECASYGKIKVNHEEVSKYKMTALHRNTKHFEEDFEKIWLKSVECYKQISKEDKCYIKKLRR